MILDTHLLNITMVGLSGEKSFVNEKVQFPQMIWFGKIWLTYSQKHNFKHAKFLSKFWNYIFSCSSAKYCQIIFSSSGKEPIVICGNGTFSFTKLFSQVSPSWSYSKSELFQTRCQYSMTINTPTITQKYFSPGLNTAMVWSCNSPCKPLCFTYFVCFGL